LESIELSQKNAQWVQSRRLHDQPTVSVEDDLRLVDQTLLNVLANPASVGARETVH